MTAITRLAAAGLARPALRFWGLALLGSAVLAASAQVALPMWPVPATLQTLAVLLLGALGGPRMGVAAVALYLGEAALGLPVLANGAGGPAALIGPTAGYLLGFVAAAWVAGHAGTGLVRQAAVLTAAHLLLFVPGVAWLATFVGWERAVAAGFLVYSAGHRGEDGAGTRVAAGPPPGLTRRRQEGPRRTATSMQAVARRPHDQPARLGGEEFAIILPNTDAEGAVHVAERLRRLVEEAGVPHADSPAGVIMISLGVATVVAGRGMADPETLIAAADAAPYRAKAAGRNGVERAAPVAA
jgi:biotin transport system substrate-specific component